MRGREEFVGGGRGRGRGREWWYRESRGGEGEGGKKRLEEGERKGSKEQMKRSKERV